jgi:hypothetical protein
MKPMVHLGRLKSASMSMVRLFTKSRVRALQAQLVELGKLRSRCMVGKVANFDQDKFSLAEIMENIDEAREQFQVCDPFAIPQRLSRTFLFHRWPSALGHLR